MSSVLASFAGHVRARPKAVFDALDARLRPVDDGRRPYTADPAAFLIIVHGRWWYRGEYRIVPDENGSNLYHSIVNVAQSAHALGPMVGRRTLSGAPADFDKLLRQLRLELE